MYLEYYEKHFLVSQSFSLARTSSKSGNIFFHYSFFILWRGNLSKAIKIADSPYSITHFFFIILYCLSICIIIRDGIKVTTTTILQCNYGSQNTNGAIFEKRLSSNSDHHFEFPLTVFITQSYLWTTTTCQKRSQIWGPI